MAKPATEARIAAAAKGFTSVVGRRDNGITTYNPATKKFALDCQVGGGWHYNGDQETDTAWEADSDQNYLKMVKAGYNLRARKLFNAGDLIQWTDPVSGKYVKFQPQNFQWIDGTTGSNSLISVAQAISAPTVSDDQLYWPAAFGAGRHFRYTASPTKLIKHLVIDSAANLPACPTWITNPWLELTFTLTPSSGVVLFVDGVAWDQATAKTTANAIEFRLPSGQVVWSMAAPLAYDSSEMGEPCNGQIKLYVNKKIKYCSVRFPKSWIDSAVFPVVLDPTLDYQVGASDDDALFSSYNSTFIKTYSYEIWGEDNNNWIYSCFMRWPGVTTPAGATITAAYISFYHYDQVGSPATCKIYFEKAANPSAVSSYSDFTKRAKTTAYVNIGTGSGTWWNSASLVSIVQELVDAYDYSAGAAMLAFVVGANAGSGNNYYRAYGYDGDPTKAPKFHIEYTEAAAGGSLVIPSHRRRFQALLVR